LSVVLISLALNPFLGMRSIAASNSSALGMWSQTPHVVVYAGETASFSIDLTASSIASVTVSLSVQGLPSDWIYSFMVENRQIRGVHLEAGKTVAIQLSVETPREASTKVYEFSVVASGQGEYEGWSFPISEELPLKVEIQSTESKSNPKITTAFPEIGAPAGSSLKYPIKVTSEEKTSDTFILTVETPENWTATFKSEAEEVYKVYLDAGESVELTVEVAPSPRVKVGVYFLTVTVESMNGRGSASLSLTARISGSYGIKILNVNFYAEVTASQNTIYSLDLKNSGDNPLTKVKAVKVSDVPDGFTVSIEPSEIASLEPNQEATFSITIETKATVNAGSYYLEFKVQSDQTETSNFSLRVDVHQQASYLTAGIALVIVAVIALVIIFRKFGRR